MVKKKYKDSGKIYIGKRNIDSGKMQSEIKYKDIGRTMKKMFEKI